MCAFPVTFTIYHSPFTFTECACLPVASRVRYLARSPALAVTLAIALSLSVSPFSNCQLPNVDCRLSPGVRVLSNQWESGCGGHRYFRFLNVPRHCVLWSVTQCFSIAVVIDIVIAIVIEFAIVIVIVINCVRYCGIVSFNCGCCWAIRSVTSSKYLHSKRITGLTGPWCSVHLLQMLPPFRVANIESLDLALDIHHTKADTISYSHRCRMFK